jgi:hypothetical protein
MQKNLLRRENRLFPAAHPAPVETVVYNGALRAAEELGADVQYVWSDWDRRRW